MKKHPLPLFQKKNADADADADFSRKNAWLPLFFFVDPNSPCKDLLFLHGPNLAQKPLYLVGTVLKTKASHNPIKRCFFVLPEIFFKIKIVIFV